MGLYETFYLFYGFMIRGIHIEELKKKIDEKWLIEKCIGVYSNGEFDGEKSEFKKVGVIVHIPTSMQTTGSKSFLFKLEKKITILPDEEFVQKLKEKLEKEIKDERDLDYNLGKIPDKKLLGHKDDDVKKLKKLKALYSDITEIGVWTYYDSFWSGGMSTNICEIERVYTQEESSNFIKFSRISFGFH